MSHARSHSSADHAAPHLPASPSAAPAAPGKQPLTLAGAAAPLQAAGRAPGAPIASDAVAGAPRGGEGTPLPPALRARMEAALGADFSRVRVHEGAHVAALGARAYAEGTDLHFAPGAYRPDAPEGQELIGHELAHVAQQAEGRVTAARQAHGVAVNDDPALEDEATERGIRAARGEATGGGAAAGGASSPARILQCFGLPPLVDLAGPIEAATLVPQIAAWLEPMQGAAELRAARLTVAAAPLGAPLRLGDHELTLTEAHRATVQDAIRRRVMERVGAVRAPLAAQLAAAHDAPARRAIQDQLRAAARPFLDELRDPAQPGARFQHPDPAVQREVLAALTLDGEGHAEAELADQAAHGDAGPRDRARATAHLPTGAWCGAFAYTQQHGAGLSEQARAAMHSTGPHQGIDSFLDYEDARRVVWTGAQWQPVRDYHSARASLRRLTRTPQTPTPITPGSVAAPQGLDLQPGDLVLIDNYRGTYADHIAQCRSYDPATGMLETIGGNEGGGDGRVAASAAPRDLNANPAAQTVPGRGKPSRVYAYGRFSIVDYEIHTYLPAMPADPYESPEAMAARRAGPPRARS
jgi:hypothetical protein